jgi:hypothetical protein
MHETNGCFFNLNKVMYFFSRTINNCLLTFIQSCLPLLRNFVVGLCVFYSCTAVWQSSNCCPHTNLLHVPGTWHVIPWQSLCTVHPLHDLAFHHLRTSKWSMPSHSRFFLSIALLGGGVHFAGTDGWVLPHAPHVPTLGPNTGWPITEQAAVAMTV